MSKEDIDQAVKAAEQYAEEDKKRREEVDTKNNAENLCYTAEKLIKDGSVEAIKTGTEELQKAVYAVSEKLYQAANPNDGNPGDPQPPYDGGANPGNPGAPGTDGNVYDADYKDVE